MLNGVMRTFVAMYSDGSREMNGLRRVAYTSRAHMSSCSTNGPNHAAPTSIAPNRSAGWRSKTPPRVMHASQLQYGRLSVENVYGSRPISMLSTLPGLNAGALDHSVDLRKVFSPPTCTIQATFRCAS